MRRDQIASSIRKITESLTATGVMRLLDSLAGSFDNQKDGNDPNIEILNVFSRFMIAYNAYSDEERDIFTRLRLDDIADPGYWASISLGQSSKGVEVRHRIWPTIIAARNVIDFSGLFISLLERAPLVPSAASDSTSVGRLTIFLRDEGVPSLTVRHLAEALTDLESLYSILCRLEGITPSPLVIGAIDSGSDKSFDVLGIAKALDRITHLMLECWDRVRFSKATKAEKSFKTFAEGLSVLNEIRDAVSKKAMSEAEGEKLKRNVLRNIDGLLSNGVYIPEMEVLDPIRPTALPIERKKLIPLYDDIIESQAQAAAYPARKPRQSRLKSTKAGAENKTRKMRTGQQ
jgi:hypothetical protein